MATATSQRRATRTFRPLGLFALVAVVLYPVVAAANALFAKTEPNDELIPGGAWLVGWLHYDSGWYVTIANSGYYYNKGQQSPIAFFPTYPLAVRALTAFGGSTYLIAQAFTLICGAIAMWLWWRWLDGRMADRPRQIAYATLLLYPYAWFLYGTAYADALFLALTIGAFVLVDDRHYVWAAIAGAFATAARPVAPAIVIGLLCVALDHSGALEGRRIDVRKAARTLILAASAIGLVAWCAWLWRTYDDPFAFLTVQSAPGWDQGAGPYTWFKGSFFNIVFGLHGFGLTLIPQAVVTVTFLALVPAVARRFGWGYGAYVLVVIGIPALGTGDFQGMGRYSLAAFPVFAFVGEWLAKRSQRWVVPTWLATSAVCLVIGAALFGTGRYLT